MRALYVALYVQYGSVPGVCVYGMATIYTQIFYCATRNPLTSTTRAIREFYKSVY